jgi:hypothetical protein
VGVAVAGIPSSNTHAHAPVECSNAGVCDRFTGTCKCHEPWTGTACDKLRCPNDCSGHGACVSMTEMTRLPEALPLKDPGQSVEYGVDKWGAAWDADIMRGIHITIHAILLNIVMIRSYIHILLPYLRQVACVSPAGRWVSGAGRRSCPNGSARTALGAAARQETTRSRK